MKKIIYSIVFFMSVSVTAFSQNGGKMQHRESKDFGKELNLSDEQKAKVKELNDTYKVKVDELRKKSSLSKDERRKQMRDLSDQKHNDMKQILTADQKAKLAEVRKDKPNRPNKMMQHRPPMQGQKTCCKAGKQELPQEVKLKLEELEANFVKERQTIRNTRIAPAMQDKKIEDLRKKYKEDKRAILKEALKK